MPLPKRKRPKHPERTHAARKPKPALKGLFLTVWKTREHKCELCGVGLNVARAHNFSHVVHRGTGGPNAPENIRILCYTCHTEYDTGRRPHNAEWMDK